MAHQPSVVSSVSSEGALAEFAALRQEIDRRSTGAQALFAFQVTVVAAVFSFASAGSGHVFAVLVLPFTSYALCVRYVDQYGFILLAGSYIEQVLDARVPDGLGWEKWHSVRSENLGIKRPERLAALLVAFGGAGLGALGWAAIGIDWEHMRVGLIVALTTVMLLGLASAVATGRLAWRLTYRICR